MPNFDPNILGAIEVGSMASVLCHGILTMQTYHYFSSFPSDARGLKLMVVAIWTAALAHLICILWGLYTLTITNFGLAPQFLGLPHVLAVGAGFGAFIHSAVQSIYIYRMYKYSGSLYIPVLCWSISAYDFIAGIIFSVTVPEATFGVQIQYLNDWSWLIYSLFVSTAFVDVIIAASLSYYLRKNRSRSMERTVHIIDRLVIWTIQTGLLTSLTALAVTITFAINKENNVWLGLFDFLTNLYPTALLALLNGRSNLKLDDALPGIRPRDLTSSGRILDIPPPIMLMDRPTQVRVTVEHDEFPLYNIVPDKSVKS
ncbi:hypothetical protein BDZ94DRAFT_1276238 [Collybia nuda]|uniref:DUF6534 domain-containing protein n=1 Tax=Collybia nuda TaxID=64659 RepID=A0A9P5XT29_9AGAR|nr:hypothetical protein BDZ94DRAFT_1276238 [Collybia nuda]